MPIFETGRKIIAVTRPADMRIFDLLQGGYARVFKVPPSVSYIRPHALDHINGLEILILQNPSLVVNVDAEISESVEFQVPSGLVSAYREKYPGRTVTAISQIPDYDISGPLFTSPDGRYALAATEIADEESEGRYTISNSYVRDLGDGRYIIIQ